MKSLIDYFTKRVLKMLPCAYCRIMQNRKAAWTRKNDNGVNYAWVDVSIAVTEMIGAATAEGVGSCWIAAIDPVWKLKGSTRCAGWAWSLWV